MRLRLAFPTIALFAAACGTFGRRPPVVEPSPRSETAPPVEPAAQPAADLTAAAGDTTHRSRRSPVYLVASLDLHGGRYLAAAGAAVNEDTRVSLASIELAAQRARGNGLGLAFRSIAGDDAPQYTELAVLLGTRQFAVDLGAAARSGFNPASGDLNDSTYAFARAGFRSRANLGNTDFSVTLRGLYYIGVSGPDQNISADLSGWSWESGLSWTWSRYPLTTNLGYRIERFRVFRVEEELSTLSLGGALLLGRK